MEGCIRYGWNTRGLYYTILRLQVPFVGFNAVLTSEHLAAHGAFALLQVLLSRVCLLWLRVTSVQIRSRVMCVHASSCAHTRSGLSLLCRAHALRAAAAGRPAPLAGGLRGPAGDHRAGQAGPRAGSRTSAPVNSQWSSSAANRVSAVLQRGRDSTGPGRASPPPPGWPGSRWPSWCSPARRSGVGAR